MGVPADSVNTFDLDENYAFTLHNHCTEAGMGNFILKLGKVCGDLLRVRLSQLKVPCDFLVAGPPCPPWSGTGNRASVDDIRARVFFRILVWIYFLVHCGGLLGVVLENVTGIAMRYDNREPVILMFLRVLRQHIPEFAWTVDRLRLRDFKIPHARVRMFLRGIRRVICHEVPPPLKPFGERPIREVLGKNIPNILLSDLSEPQQHNLAMYENTIIQQFNTGRFAKGDIVMFPVDRVEDAVSYKGSISINICPTLTCSNRYLLVSTISDIVDNVPYEKREFFRWLANVERLTLQGFRKEVALELTDASAFKAAGNAYPIPLIISAVHPMIQAIHQAIAAGFNFVDWPPSEMLEFGTPIGIAEFERAIQRKPKLLPKQQHKAGHPDSMQNSNALYI